jgi:hypothetical protein|tara:strand:- start:1794 stop:2117 length:324 start_codon:yes stop_codon:yes gene_type:complete
MLYLYLACPSLLFTPLTHYSSQTFTPTMQFPGADVSSPFKSNVVSPTSKPMMSDGDAILVQGGSLRTWAYNSMAVEQVNVNLGTNGRPLDAEIELWHGPDNTPWKMR